MKCPWEEKVKKLNCWDFCLAKLSTAAFGLVVFKVIKIIWGWDAFSLSIWWWLVIAIILGIKPVVKIFTGKKPEQKVE